VAVEQSDPMLSTEEERRENERGSTAVGLSCVFAVQSSKVQMRTDLNTCCLEISHSFFATIFFEK